MKTMEITLNRTIPAGPAEVFDAWLNPDHPGSPWYGVERNIMSAVPEGLFYRLQLSGNATDPDRYGLPHYGRFIAVDRPRQIQHTWLSQHTRGIESLVTVDFTAQGNDTLLLLRHEGLPDDEFGRMHDGGWNHYLKALTCQFGAKQ